MDERERVSTRERHRERESAWTTTLWWLIWILWIPFFIPVLAGFFQTQPAPMRAVLSVSGVALFFGAYMWITRLCGGRLAGAETWVPRDRARRWAPIALLLALAVALTLWNGFSWGTLFIYACTAAAGWLPLWEAVGVVAGAVAFEAVGLRGDASAAVNAIAFTLIPAAIVIALMRSVLSAQQVRDAREELARLAAVAEERLRIARDLHDLLGHNLSVIALKSELARRLIAVAPERAAAEIGDVEGVARTALREVREAVTGYRQPSLASELAGARELLAAAGTTCQIEDAGGASQDLPPALDAALAWAVREGVTNVMRHGRARSCTIRLRRGADELALEIENDTRRGLTPPTASPPPGAERGADGGHGLRGVAERMAALGGTCEAGPWGAGFRLRATLPLGRDAPPAHQAAPADAAGQNQGDQTSLAVSQVAEPGEKEGEA